MIMPFQPGYPPWNKDKHMSKTHRKKLSKALKTYWETHKETVEKARQGRLKYYQTHEVWNKGLKWPEDVKERTRQACLESKVGMGPASGRKKKKGTKK
jgi:hypothetical protein